MSMRRGGGRRKEKGGGGKESGGTKVGQYLPNYTYDSAGAGIRINRSPGLAQRCFSALDFRASQEPTFLNHG